MTSKSVNLSALSAILTEDASIVKVQFVAGEKEYTYKVPTAWNVKTGDTIVVNAPYSKLESKMTAVDVVSVQDYLDLELDATYTYKWAVSKVDKLGYEDRILREEAFLEDIRRTRLKARKRQAYSELIEGADASEVADMERAIARLNGKALPQPQAPYPSAPTPRAPQQVAPAAPPRHPMPTAPSIDPRDDMDNW